MWLTRVFLKNLIYLSFKQRSKVIIEFYDKYTGVNGPRLNFYYLSFNYFRGVESFPYCKYLSVNRDDSPNQENLPVGKVIIKILDSDYPIRKLYLKGHLYKDCLSLDPRFLKLRYLIRTSRYNDRSSFKLGEVG